MNALLKTLGVVPLLFFYLLAAILIAILPVAGGMRRSLRIRTASFFARLALVLLGIRMRVKHHERLHKHGGARLIVANHVSYVDVLVIASLTPTVFITSVEMKQTPLLGSIARFAGCLFVERRRPSGLKEEIGAIARVLGQGLSVVLFPEGTTSNGDRVQPFKNSLFDAAVAARAEVLPLCLRYVRINDESLTARNRDNLFYYGGVSFFRHFPRFLRLKSVEVVVMPLRAIKVHAHTSRKELAALVHYAISAAYHG